MTGESTSPPSRATSGDGPLADAFGQEHWENLAAEWTEDDSYRLWRRHSDWVNGTLLTNWLQDRPVKRLLKTDLFDEAVCRGLAPYLFPQAEQITGIDLSYGMAELAQRRYPQLCVQQADVRRLPFEADYFDTVVSLSTLDHFESLNDVAASLREIHRVLRPGGQLLITLDNLVNPAIWLRSKLPFPLLNRLGIVPYYVGRSCGPKLFRRYIHEAELVPEETTAVLHCPRVLAVAFSRWLRRRASTAMQERFLGCLRPFEILARLPTRFITGHFVAIRARKPD